MAKRLSDEGSALSMTDDRVKHHVGRIESEKAKVDTANGEHGNCWRAFENEGGLRPALKMAIKLKNMETLQAQAWVRAFKHYCDVLGLFDQLDLMDDFLAAQDAPAESPSTQRGRRRMKEGNGSKLTPSLAS